MIFAHTFWSKPLLNKKFSAFNESLANIILDYGLSAELIKRAGHKIILYGDKTAIDILSFISYDNCILLDIPENESYHFAASIKFYALQQMKLHEILIDGDIFIEYPMTFNLIKNAKQDILYSFYENNFVINKFEYMEDYFNKLFSKIGNVSLKYPLCGFNEISYPNTSCIKFNSQSLKDKWIESYFYHKNLLSNIDFEDTWPDIILEQYILGKIIEENNYSFKEIIPNYPNDSEYIKKLGFTHLGSAKTKILPTVYKVFSQTNMTSLNKALEQYKRFTGNNLCINLH